MHPILMSASKIAIPNNKLDKRSFWLGAIGLRSDGVSVCSKNGASAFSTSVEAYHFTPHSHAEGRVVRKLGKHGIVYVARVARKDKTLAMARPCSMCRILLRSYKVKKVFYTIDNNHYGIWLPHKDTDVIIDC